MAEPWHVPGGDFHPGHRRQRRGHQAALQGERGGTILPRPQRLHGHRRPVGSQLQQRGVIVGETPVPQRADMQHPQHHPCTSSGTPTSDRMPFASNSGLSTVS